MQVVLDTIAWRSVAFANMNLDAVNAEYYRYVQFIIPSKLANLLRGGLGAPRHC